MRDGGKGDAPRPLGVPLEMFDNNWETIFGKKKNEFYDISIEWTEGDPVVQDNGRVDSQHVNQPK